MAQISNIKIQLRKDLLSNWTSANPILRDGEIAIAIDEEGLENLKIGNGISSFTQLPFLYQRNLKTDLVSAKEVTAKSISQGYNVHSTPTSLATGIFTEASANFGVVHGIEALIKPTDDYAFVFNGENLPGINERYFSHGEGSFNVNPLSGLNGFYIGEESLSSILSGYFISNEISNYYNKLDNVLSVTNNIVVGDASADISAYCSLATGLGQVFGGHSVAESHGFAYGYVSHTEGNMTKTGCEVREYVGNRPTKQMLGMASHAEGTNTEVSGWSSHAEGTYNKVYSDFSHVEGGHNTVGALNVVITNQESYDRIGPRYTHDPNDVNNNISLDISGNYSHAEGYDCYTIGYVSHVEGVRSKALHDYTYVWNGMSAITPRYYLSHNIGTYNINPISGICGFYIGENNLCNILSNNTTSIVNAELKEKIIQLSSTAIINKNTYGVKLVSTSLAIDGNGNISEIPYWHLYTFIAKNDFDLWVANDANLTLGLYSDSQLTSTSFITPRRRKTDANLPYEDSKLHITAGLMIVVNVYDRYSTLDFLLFVSEYAELLTTLKASIELADSHILQVLKKIAKKSLLRYTNIPVGSAGGYSDSLECVFIYSPAYAGYIRYAFIHSVKEDIKCDVWRLTDASLVDDDLGLIYNITLPGEIEFVIALSSTNEYVGGYTHGNEIMTTLPSFFINGVESDISTYTLNIEFDTLNIIRKSDIFDYHDNDNKICEHNVEYIFNNDEMTLNLIVKWTINSELKRCCCGMFTPKKTENADGTGLKITEKMYTDMSCTSYTLPNPINPTITMLDVEKVSLYSDESKFKFDFDIIKNKTSNAIDHTVVEIGDNGGINYNKIYNMIGYNTNVQENDIWKSSLKYTLNSTY